MKMRHQRHLNRPAKGLSILEVLVVVTLIGILAVIALTRFSGSKDAANANGCSVNRTNIEIQAQLWFRNKGSWPATNLSDLMGDTAYFPDGPVSCPVNPADPYVFDPATQRLTGHAH